MYTFAGYRSWPELYGTLKAALHHWGSNVDTGHWQSLKDVPHTKTRELQHVALELPVQPTVAAWQQWFEDAFSQVSDEAVNHLGLNLPWAEDHFQERIAGEPTNPGEQYLNWPWYRSGVEDHKQPGVFSHTYMERLWPRRAGDNYPLGGRVGIRYKYGDLHTLLDLLRSEPYTRQAYVPMWFPEDLEAAAHEAARVPCSLGWHFMLRDNQLHCFYPMRSVDLYRYLPDDLYMAGRLVQWIIERLIAMRESWILNNVQDPTHQEQALNPWEDVTPGKLTLFASSLHVFEGDLPRLKREVKRFEKDYGQEARDDATS